VRIFMTGVTGFVGRVAAARLASEHEVFATVRANAVAPDGVIPVAWDLTTPAPTEGLPSCIDVIVHAAQSRRYREFPEGASDTFSVNVAATVALLSYACKAGATAFVLVSSGTVYEPYRGPIVEDAPLAPTSLNGATKLAAEALAFAYESLFSICALRLFFPYGRGQVDRLIPEVIRRVRQGEPVHLVGQNGLYTAPIFVTDVADVILAAVMERWSGRVNLAGTRLVSVRQLAVIISQIIGTRAYFDQADGTAPVIAPDLSRLQCLYDTNSFLPLEDGLRQSVY
jgi:UDP-glucose 4-epimerase